MKRLRVAIVASTLDVGGAEHVLDGMVHRLSDRAVARVFTLKNAGTVGDRLASGGMLAATNLSKGRLDPLCFFRLRAALRSFHPDVILTLDHHDAIFWTGVVSPFVGSPVRIIASHTTGRMNGEKNFTGVDRWFLRSADAVISLSESHTEYLRDVEEVNAGKIVVIPNGIDLDRFEAVDAEEIDAIRDELGIAAGDHVVTMVAVLRPEKAHDALLSAARQLTKAYPGTRVHYLIVGDGSLRRSLQEQAAALGIDSRVQFLGERSDVAQILHLSDVAVLPSHAAVETLPLALLEAMAAGVPIVASAVGSVPELIEDGVTGRLIKPADADGLANAIWFILNDDQKRLTYVENARNRVHSKYSVNRMAADYEALFERLATNGGSPA